MRKLRNPRYAPESLERKLSPSAGLSSSLASVAIYSTIGGATTTNPGGGSAAANDDPPSNPNLPGNGEPPNDPMPPPPTGPVGPA